MSYAYTPGLRVSRNTVVRKSRILPLLGKVLVREGDTVKSNTIVAQTDIPGDVDMFPIAYSVGVEPRGLNKAMLKKEGDSVEEGELIASSTSFFGLFKNEYKAEIGGIIELISDVTGMVAIRQNPRPIQLTAYIPGKIVEVFPRIGVVVETTTAFIQGIFGIGGERQGELMTIADPEGVLNGNSIPIDCKGKILVGGSMVTADALRKAEKLGAVGIICGGIQRKDLTSFLGYEMGVAITGAEEIDLTCIITEGFDKMSMAGHTFELLDSLEGQKASINGATQIRAGVVRPEVIIPIENPETQVSAKKNLVSGMVPGMRVRIISQPYFGAICHIVSLPVELQKLETESSVRVLEVRLEVDGFLSPRANVNKDTIIIPRANVELIEE